MEITAGRKKIPTYPTLLRLITESLISIILCDLDGSTLSIFVRFLSASER